MTKRLTQPRTAARGLAAAAVSALACGVAAARQPATGPAVPVAVTAPPAAVPTDASAVSPDLVGRRVDDVRVAGNAEVSSQVILNVVQTHVGDRFDPATVARDYQKVYELHRFAEVRADVAFDVDGAAGGSPGGVVVTFRVAEEKLIHAVRFVNDKAVDADDLRKAIDLKVGEAIEPFRIGLAQRAIVAAYRQKNYPYARVEVDRAELSRTGDLVFTVVEGPEVTVRNVVFVGGVGFTDDTLRDQIKTSRYFFIFSAGTLDSEQVDQDVAAVKKFYVGKGYFNAKVGRKIVVSPDQTEVQVDFLIDAGPRYRVGRVSFTGNAKRTDAELRANLRLTEGMPFDADVLQRDVKSVVAAYSPLGYIYDPRNPQPDYLRIGTPDSPFGVRTVLHEDPGVVDLVYDIGEGKPFTIGRVIVAGDDKTRETVIRDYLPGLEPGRLYDSAAVAAGGDALRATPYFGGNATITPIGTDPGVRDLLVNVTEARTASVSAAASVNSNFGFGGELSYEQDNFDLFNFPRRLDDVVGERAFVGGGQTFRASFAPGVQTTNASLLFSTPFILDLPYTNTDEAYFRQIFREWGYERRSGGSVTVGKQFGHDWTAGVTFLAEDVKIGGVEDYYPLSDRVDVFDPVTHQPLLTPTTGDVATQLRSVRSPQVLEYNGHNTVTNVGLQVRRDTTNRGPLPYEGSSLRLGYKFEGALGGKFDFSSFSTGYDLYKTVYTDLLDRRTVVHAGIDGDYITPDAPFFERFYGGGLGNGYGSLRGFQFRGVGPRDGRALDPVGGDLNLVGTVEVNFPIFGDNFRGVLFTDFGTVEPDIRIHTIRDTVGAGVRVTIPQLGFKTPIGLNFAFPVNKGPQDIPEVFSFGIRR